LAELGIWRGHHVCLGQNRVQGMPDKEAVEKAEKGKL
jgi:hypothetical protein